MNIVLIGYRGTGKSEVSSILGKRLGMTCVGMDAEIVRRAACSIPEIVEKEGWTAFRDRESELARDLASQDNIIIDCGGGIIERPENIEALKKSGILFWLKASVNTIVKRIEGCSQRPALTEGKSFTEEIAEVLEVRTPKYKDAAHFEIDTDLMTPEEVAEKIITRWKQG
ncbi:MAG: shikimate kinase [Proteobacteria bacterium]|nr:shikimate kinase [Pseudomonadota bacterium]